MTPDEIIKGAIKVLETDGHTKVGKYYQAGEGYCALGALGKAAGDTQFEETGCLGVWKRDEFVAAVGKVAAAAGLADYSEIPEWNDDEASTEDVILAMKKAVTAYGSPGR